MADLSGIRVGFIGAGVMAFALAKGFVESGRLDRKQIFMLVRNDVKRSLVEDLGYTAVCDPRDVAVADVIFLSVKPQDAVALLKEISFMIHEKKHLLISICAGVDLNSLTNALNHNRAMIDEDNMNRRICRVMPNTPCQIRRGVSVFCVGAGCTLADVGVINTLLTAVGTSYKIEEKHMAAASAISGSGPAFVFNLLDALSDGGVKNGLPRKLAQDLAMDMVAGSAALARAEFGRRHFAELKDQVTSPGGTTIAGIAALERWGFRNAGTELTRGARGAWTELTKCGSGRPICAAAACTAFWQLTFCMRSRRTNHTRRAARLLRCARFTTHKLAFQWSVERSGEVRNMTRRCPRASCSIHVF